jgi:hypothetical protein
MATIHVALNQESHKIWVAPRVSDLSNKFGKEYISWQENAPIQLENFFRENSDMKEYFHKGFAYWIVCKLFGVQEKEGQYGLLKRRLSEFSKKLFRALRSLADKIAREMRKKI